MDKAKQKYLSQERKQAKKELKRGVTREMSMFGKDYVWGANLKDKALASQRKRGNR